MTSATFTLLALSAAVAVLAVLTLLFAIVALLLRWRNVRRASRWHGLELRWQGLLLDVLAGDAEPDELHAIVLPRERAYFVGFLLRFLKRLRGDERERVMAVARPHLPAVARQLRSRSAERRARAVQTLSLLAGETYRDAIQAALDDPAPLVVMVAARALSRRRDPKYAAAILRHLESFRDWRPRFLAAMLAALGPEAGPALVATLRDRARPGWVRAVAADALRALNDLGAADASAEALEAETDPELLAACLRLLGALGRPEHLPGIRAHVATADQLVRATAAGALADLGGPEDVETLERLLSDASPWVALEAAHGLARGVGRDALRALAASDHPRAGLAREALFVAAA